MEILIDSADPSLATWWFEERKDPETRRYNPLAPSSVESLRERLSKASSDLAEYERADSFLWIIRSGKEPIGHVSLQNINRMMRTAEIGYGVTQSARGRGIGARVVRLVAQNVFAQTPIRKLIAFVHEQNLPSCKLLEKVGFRQEGLLRQHYIVNGVAANEAIYGLLKEELIQT
jgi:[ribosomal protein S5]-alanine N-acetyltransferase